MHREKFSLRSIAAATGHSRQKVTEVFEKAKERLINGNLKLVLSILRKYVGRCDNLDDLFQVGCLGLVKAIDNFDTSYDVKLSTYVSRCIDNEIVKVGDVVIVKYNGEISEDNYVTGAYSINKGTLVESEPVILE